MNKLILIPIICLLFSGCSFLPKLTFNRTTSTLPMATDKSIVKERCSGIMKKDPTGTITECSKGYYRNENLFNQTERKFTPYEKISNFFRNIVGWAFWLLVPACFLIPGLAGFLYHRITSISGKGFPMLVKGIQDGKNYVRSNGTNYTEAERLIYNKGADDMLSKITEAVTDPKVKEKIAVLRSQL